MFKKLERILVQYINRGELERLSEIFLHIVRNFACLQIVFSLYRVYLNEGVQMLPHNPWAKI